MKNLHTILLVGLSVAVTVIVMLIFGRGKQPIDHTGEIKAKDEVIKMITDDRNYYRSHYDSVIRFAQSKDTLLIREYKTTNTVYEKIPAIIAGTSKDSLRAIAKGYHLSADR